MAAIVITGSTRGIGLGLAKAFRVRGHDVVITSRSKTAVDAAIAQVSATPGQGQVVGTACDVGNRTDIQALWDFAKAKLGRVDIWINNAGLTGPRRNLDRLTDADIDAVIRTNLYGSIYGTQIPLAGMTAQGSGKIFNFEGFGSDGMSAAGLTLYGTTKRAITYFTKSVNKEFKGSPVLIGTLSPGIVVTDLLDTSKEEDPERWEKAKKFYNILADKVETVAPYLTDQVLATTKPGAAIRWLTTPKAIGRFVGNLFKKRRIFDD
jgi:NAD(P)-dependent dehydrogenase (short-subunit alcohol dehydrogenase family)